MAAVDAPCDMADSATLEVEQASPRRLSTDNGKPSALQERLNLGRRLSVSTVDHQPEGLNLGRRLSVPTVDHQPERQSSVTLFRSLSGGEVISDYYELDKEVYSAGSKGRVLLSKRKNDGAEVVV